MYALGVECAACCRRCLCNTSAKVLYKEGQRLLSDVPMASLPMARKGTTRTWYGSILIALWAGADHNASYRGAMHRTRNLTRE